MFQKSPAPMEIRTFLEEPAKVAETMYKSSNVMSIPKVYNSIDIQYFSNFKPNIFHRFIIFPPEYFRPSAEFPTEYFRPSAGLSNNSPSPATAQIQINIIRYIPLYSISHQVMGFYDIITMSLLTAIPIMYTFPMILAHLFKIQGYKITDQTECNQLVSKLNI